ncbi:MAG: ubiquitin-activating E1 FCCH domain-containing protein [Pseudomonadota bacterium]
MKPARHRRRKEPPGIAAGLLRRFRNESGAVAIWFAVLALPLAVLSFGLIDVNRAGVEKRHLQDALDAATLLAARSTADTDAELQAVGEAALAAQLSGMSDATLVSSSFKLAGSTVVGSATASVDPVIADLWLQGEMMVGAKAEVVRASTNLEMTLVLDITGSMWGSKLADLKTAAKDLIDLVVQDSQTPYYSKAALVPFSLGVNLGSYAAGARGAQAANPNITAATWYASSKSITGATKTNPVRITSNAHGFSDGDYVYISGVNGMTQLNGKIFQVTGAAANTFKLNGVNGLSYNKYTSGGTVRKCLTPTCELVVTAAGHGLAAGDGVLITGTVGLTGINDVTFTVASPTTNTFALSGVFGPTSGAYASGGKVYCLKRGCQYYAFTRADGYADMFELSTCVSERTGADAYTDTAPSTSLVGRVYLESPSSCPGSTIVPLSTDKAVLKANIDSYAATGATAGQIGAAWGWYLLSPNFAYLWPSVSQPGSYAKTDLLKVMVFMTDGDFNTAYCKDVLSNDSNGSNWYQINCNATNGNPTTQAQAICTAMKAKGIVIYTVGFQVSPGSAAETFIKGCASDSDHIYLPSSGAALKDAFSAIGQDILSLRLSK